VEPLLLCPWELGRNLVRRLVKWLEGAGTGLPTLELTLTDTYTARARMRLSCTTIRAIASAALLSTF
jgi:hypothetical protein